MPEVKTPIKQEDDESFVITTDHTIADIVRWIIKEGMDDEVRYFLDRPEEI